MLFEKQEENESNSYLMDLEDGDFVVFEYSGSRVKNAIRCGVRILDNNTNSECIESDDATYSCKEITRIIKVIPFKEYSKILLKQVKEEYPEEFL